MAEKLVEFEKWCGACIHKDVREVDEPCNECLTHTTNEDSHRPVEFKQNSKMKSPIDA